MADVKVVCLKKNVAISVKPVNEILQTYLHALKAYFKEAEALNPGLVRLKMMELLYNLASADENLLLQILQLKQSAKTDISSVMEENYTTRLTLSELAYFSGRSLSVFKRDFLSVYNMPPAQWIRTKRLQKAKLLLSADTIPQWLRMYSTENICRKNTLMQLKY